MLRPAKTATASNVGAIETTAGRPADRRKRQPPSPRLSPSSQPLVDAPSGGPRSANSSTTIDRRDSCGHARARSPRPEEAAYHRLHVGMGWHRGPVCPRDGPLPLARWDRSRSRRDSTLGALGRRTPTPHTLPKRLALVPLRTLGNPVRLNFGGHSGTQARFPAHGGPLKHTLGRWPSPGLSCPTAARSSDTSAS